MLVHGNTWRTSQGPGETCLRRTRLSSKRLDSTGRNWVAIEPVGSYQRGELELECADSSFGIDVLHGEPRALKHVGKLRTAGRSVALPAPVITEVMLEGLARGGNHLAQTLELIASLDVLPVDAESASEAAHVGFQMARMGKTLDLADLLIAGIFIQHRSVLITRDSDFDAIPGLAVIHY